MPKQEGELKEVIDHLQKAYKGFMAESTIQAHFGNIEWADAIDKVASAITSLGFEPEAGEKAPKLEPAKVVIFVEGGAVQTVIGDKPLEYLVIDYDETDESAVELTDTSKHKFTASIEQYSEKADAEGVEHYWKQIPAA